MIKAAIVDDEAMARESLKHLLSKVQDVEIVSVAESALEIQATLVDHAIDVLFLDIEMPDLSGLELLATVKNLPNIVLTTNHPEHAVEAFEYEVVDFLTKPVYLVRLNKALDRIRAQQEPENDNREDFFVRSEARYVRVPFDDLLYVKTLDDYVILQLGKEKHIVHSTLSKMERRLPDARFQKVHRSYLVNLSKITDVEDTTLAIDRHVIPVSRAFRSIIKNRLGLN